MKFMPLFYYPTQTVWVDDDKLFLQTVANRLAVIINIKSFYSSKECRNEIIKSESMLLTLPLLKGYKEHDAYDLIDHMPVDINLNSIADLRNNNNRFEEVSVLVTDYNMPEINGIELCYELKELPIKKILLTGDASHQLAVKAFNEGIIDCFIRKDDPGFLMDLLTQIKRLQYQYFIDMSSPLMSHLEVDYKLPQSDLKFSNYFAKWCEDNNICEYYVFDKNGSLITIDRDENSKYFIAHTDRSLDGFEKLYEEDQDIASFTKAVNQRIKVPFFGFQKEPWDYEFTRWMDHFYSPVQYRGRENYYCVVVPE